MTPARPVCGSSIGRPASPDEHIDPTVPDLVCAENGRRIVRWLAADWGENKEHVFRDVLASLNALGHSAVSVPRSDMERRQELVNAIRSGDFDVLLTWQRFYRNQKDLRSAVADSGIRTVYMDYGFLPHYRSVVFDSEGENAASTWPRLWREGGPADLSQEDLDAAESLMRSEAARARTLALPALPGLQGLRTPFIFVPLQRPRDAVIRHDSSVHDFGELFRRVLFLARGRAFVVCKTHPLDHDLDLGVPDSVHGSHLIVRKGFGDQNEAVCDYLLSRASLVVGVNSNMLFRSLLFGTPVLATGSGWYTGSGAVHEAAGIKGLTSLSVPFPDLEAQKRYVATCMTRQLGFEDLSISGRLESVLCRIGIEDLSEAVGK